MKSIENTLAQLSLTGNLRTIPYDTATSRAVDLSTNDYLGLAQDMNLRARFLESLSPQGFLPSASASRLLSAHQNSYSRLEHRLGQLYGREALLFNSGYHANTGLISALGDKNTLFVADKLVHASIIDGLVLSGARFVRFAHGNYNHLCRLITKYGGQYGRIVIVAESVYSMDGDSADIRALIEAKTLHPDTLLYIDEAHAVGVCGPAGLGLSMASGHADNVDIIVGTFGKALASAGAFAIMTPTLRSFMVNKARSLIFSTSLPPMVTDWSLLTLNHMLSMDDEREHLRALSRSLAEILAQYPQQGCGGSGTATADDMKGTPSHIQPLIIGDATATVLASAELLRKGFKVLPIRTPTVPAGTERLRFSLSAALSLSQLLPLHDAVSALSPNPHL